MNKLKYFNTKDTVLVVTSYPDPADSKYGRKEFNAVGWHSTKTLSRLATHGKVGICAEKRQFRHREGAKGNRGDRVRLPRSKSTSHFVVARSARNDNLLVARVWEKGNLLSFFELLRFILKQSQIRSIFVQFEFNVYGGILPNLALLGVLGVLRLLGRSVTFEMHQVIIDIALLAKHINITNRFAQAFFNAGLRAFYRVTGFVANTVIVFEEELKERLVHLGITDRKIEVFSLSIDKKVKMNRLEARKKIGIPEKEFVLMVFGFINGYKGIDWIIEALKDVNEPTHVIAKTGRMKQSLPAGRQGQTDGIATPLRARNNKRKIRLLIAGGANPYLKDKPAYQTFYNSIVTAAGKHTHITHTGFIPDADVALYFSASDLVVLPYEVFMSASGPFSLSLSYGTPVILSEALSDYSKSYDFQKAMREAGITAPELFFPLERQALLSLLQKAQTDNGYLNRLTAFSEILAQYRDSRSVVLHLHTVLTSPTNSFIPSVTPSIGVEV